MSDAYQTLLADLLDSWDRNNTILVNLLSAISDDALAIRATNDSPTIAGMFAHINYVRLVFISEDVPEIPVEVPTQEWEPATDRRTLIEQLNESATAVRLALKTRIESRRAMELHYDHPVLFLQHMIWHEGYHHGQIKLALKLAGHPLSNKQAGPLTWGIWMNKK